MSHSNKRCTQQSCMISKAENLQYDLSWTHQVCGWSTTTCISNLHALGVKGITEFVPLDVCAVSSQTASLHCKTKRKVQAESQTSLMLWLVLFGTLLNQYWSIIIRQLNFKSIFSNKTQIWNNRKLYSQRGVII